MKNHVLQDKMVTKTKFVSEAKNCLPMLFLFFPCKIGTGISPGSRRDPAKIPGTDRDPARIPPRWPVFPRKIPAAFFGKNLAEKSVLAGILPRKKSSPGSRREPCREVKS